MVTQRKQCIEMVKDRKGHMRRCKLKATLVTDRCLKHCAQESEQMSNEELQARLNEHEEYKHQWSN